MTISRIYGGHVVTPDAVLENKTLTIENNRIVDISSASPLSQTEHDIDAGGKWIFPGFIDTHSDTLEREIQPRPGSILPVHISFFELERKLAGQGITTMYHALGMRGSSTENYMRQNDRVHSLIYTLKEFMREAALIRHRLHLRYEITNIEAVPIVEELIEKKMLHQISFTDHTPGQGQWKNIDLQKQLIMSRSQLTERETDHLLEEKKKLQKVETRKLKEISELASKHQIPIASHDDDTVEKLRAMDECNVKISEFPIEMDVAHEAKRMGFYTVMGAPNVLLGKSHSNNLSALEAIKAGVVDILCSDYYPPSLMQSIFKLHQLGYDLPFAVNLVSHNPAKALGISDQLGSIEIGKLADILIVSDHYKQPIIEKVIVGGEEVCSMNYFKSMEPAQK